MSTWEEATLSGTINMQLRDTTMKLIYVRTDQIKRKHAFPIIQDLHIWNMKFPREKYENNSELIWITHIKLANFCLKSGIVRTWTHVQKECAHQHAAMTCCNCLNTFSGTYSMAQLMSAGKIIYNMTRNHLGTSSTYQNRNKCLYQHVSLYL
jgi:hypothetical protein